MKGRALLLDAAAGWEAAAVIEGGVLEDLLLRRDEERAAPGPEALYRARLGRRLKEADALFLELGGGESGFLSPAGAPDEQRSPAGAGLLAEIRVHPEPGKAWPATRRIALRSRRLSLTPGAPGLNLSRGIKDAARRAALSEALARAFDGAGEESGEGVGCIARSVAGDDPDGVEAEAAWLLARWEALASPAGAAPSLLQSAPGPIALALREGRVGGARLMATTRSLGAPLDAALAPHVAPGDPIRARIEAAEPDLFERFDVAGQAEAALRPRRDLDRGAWMAVEPTAALVALDVNSGEGGALAADLAAAGEAPRLLRLAGLGGLIAADFISRSASARGQVERALARALARDPVETRVLGWTAGGLLELTRRRARRPLTRERLDRWRRETT